MTRKHSTKRSLIASIIVLCLCLSTLIGTTFAWFTDSVTSGGNIIKSGTLDVTMEWFDGAKDVPDVDSDEWTDASTGAIFEYDLWEPGYVAVRHIKIANEGTLALKYSLKIVTEDEVGKLAEVIDVYYIDPAVKLERDALTPDKKLGTLAEILTDLSTASGNLEAGENHTVTLALKMQESAGNEYQDKQVAASFAIQLLATQLTSEEDSFDDQYDKDAENPIVPAYPATTADELAERLKNALPGEEIFVAAGTFELSTALSIPNGVTLYGAQAGVAASKWVNDASAEKTVIKYTGASGGTVLDIYQASTNPEEAVGNIEINGILIDCNGTAGKGISIKKCSGSEAIENVKIVNCAVINSTNDGIDAGNCYGAVIENNYVSGVVDTAIRLGNYNGYHWQTWEEVTAYVCNNVIDGVSGSANGAIMLDNGMGDVVVSGNVIRNVTAQGSSSSSSVKASAIHVYDVYEGGEILIENNTIENADQGIAIYKYTYSTVYGESWWEGPTTDNDGIVISANKISGYDAFAITTSKLNEKSGAFGATAVEIKNNVITGGADDKAIVIRDENSGWSVVTVGNEVNGVDYDGSNTTAEGIIAGGDSLSAANVEVSLPSSLSKSSYVLKVGETSISTSENDETTISMDITLLNNGVKVESNDGITVSVYVGENLVITGMTHNGVAVNDYSYNPTTGIITFDTESFSPFTFSYTDKTVKVSSYEELVAVLDAIKTSAKQQIPGENGNRAYRENAIIVLESDIVIDADSEFMYTDSNGAPLHIYGMKGIIDLNGHNITVAEDALLAGKSHSNAVLLFQYSNVSIVGEGGIYAYNKSIPIYAWANCTVDIYGGNYKTNAFERNESAVYVNNTSALVNVYGGTYAESEYAFNVHDNCGSTTTIVLHEGITYADFLKNGTTDVTAADINAGRIAIADGCVLVKADNVYTVTAK